jgi:putative oxidoreductase
MKKLFSTLGKILFALPLLVFGLFHLVKFKEMAQEVPSFLPFHVFWIIITGLGLMAAAVSLLINKYVTLSMFLLAVFLLSTILMVYLPGLKSSPSEMVPILIGNLLKDLAILGGALYFAGTNKES